jgi:SAM-dependent methyltransferase
MYKRIRECLEKNHCLPIKGSILGISGIDSFYYLIDAEKGYLTEVTYPEIDMQCLPYKAYSFDFVLSDQVIEHVADVPRAIEESHRVLKRGGIAIHTTCFMNYIHPCPNDFWRFSCEALEFLCRRFSRILCCEGWGNRIAILLCFLSDRFRFARIPERKWSIRYQIANYNEKRYPIVSWIVAKK